MKKKINYRLWSIFSLIVLLFPLLASLGQGSATSSDEYILPESGFEFNVVAGGFEGEDGITEVKNFEKGRLPITGGMERLIFLLIGLATMLGVGIYYMKRRQQA